MFLPDDRVKILGPIFSGKNLVAHRKEFSGPQEKGKRKLEAVMKKEVEGL